MSQAQTNDAVDLKKKMQAELDFTSPQDIATTRNAGTDRGGRLLLDQKSEAKKGGLSTLN